jgi:serine/threonine protein kinase
MDKDPYKNLVIDGYSLKEFVGEGGVGKVYKAISADDTEDELACKIISRDRLKDNWRGELKKITKHVVQYHSSGMRDENGLNFVYIFFDFVNGKDLKSVIEKTPEIINIAFIEALTKAFLHVLHACEAVKIHHGDIHDGNVMISDPDPRRHKRERSFLITDFGYGCSQNDDESMDDYRQISSIILKLLSMIPSATLNSRDRILQADLRQFFQRDFLEHDPTQQPHTSDKTENSSNTYRISILLERFEQIRREAQRKSTLSESVDLKTDDYLVAEALGYQVHEWQNLFVPEFLGADELLSKNNTVLTGARGCGKTMAFRRLTVLMDEVIQNSSGVKGCEEFHGFYLNCRDIAEAFPWAPRKLSRGAKEQVIQFFNLSWLSEILRATAIRNERYNDEFDWLIDWLKEKLPNSTRYLDGPGDPLSLAMSLVESLKEECRLTRFGLKSGYGSWPLAQLNTLDSLNAALRKNLSWLGDKPIFFFIDDYTVPIITRDMQIALNPILFCRKPDIFFKVSTEAANSFVRTGVNGKPLEIGHDYRLVDLANESLYLDPSQRKELLDKIFRPRIKRHEKYSLYEFGLTEVLGKTTLSNNEMARRIRDSSRLVYGGEDVFVGIWSSDVRSMIQILTDMINTHWSDSRNKVPLIDLSTQDKKLRNAGGEFLALIESVKNPISWDEGLSIKKTNSNSQIQVEETYGKHLRDIAQAFINVSNWELAKGELIKNQKAHNPRQAFRLEIIDNFKLPKDALEYYHGLVRWHIFLQDWRGKSMRGKVTPRLYLNRVLIPFSNLTFSTKDNIPLKNGEFVKLLRDPNMFFEYWRNKKRAIKKSGSSQINLPLNQEEKEHKKRGGEQ